MNELMMIIGKGHWIYAETDCENCDEAMRDFERKLDSIGIDVSNLGIDKCVLRNESYEVIDEFEY